MKNFRRCAAPAAVLTAAALTPPSALATEYYVAQSLDGAGSTWDFGIKMAEQDDGTFTHSFTKDNNGTAYFTFFDYEATGWNQSGKRFGDPEGEEFVDLDKKYPVGENSYCYKFTQQGAFIITFNYDDNDSSNSYVIFTKESGSDTDSGSDTGSGTDTGSDQDTGSTTDPDDAVYVYFENNSNWSQPYVWAWNENANCCYETTWPGDAMTKAEDSDNLWYWRAPAGKVPTKIIFNIGSNDAQTGDLSFTNKATYRSDGNTTGDVYPTPPVPAEGAGPVTDWERDDKSVTVTCENANLYITPYSAHVVKVFTLPKNNLSADERRTITVNASPAARFDVKDNAYTLTITVEDGVNVLVDKETGLISFIEGPIAEADTDNPTLAEAKYLNNSGNTRTVSFRPAGDEAFYGGGYNGKWGSVNGQTLTMNNTQTGGWGGTDKEEYPHCITIPFVVSTKGYGVLFDDHWRGAVMKPSSREGLSYSSGSQNPISYYYIGGGNLDEVIANYTSLTGRQDLPPYWALGYITSRYGYHSESEANEYINGILNADIPLDGIVFDLYWEGEDESGMGNLDWNSNKFPNPRTMLKGWKEKGIHTTLITEPFFTSNCNNWEAVKQYLADDNVSNMTWLKSAQVGLLDASYPVALDWMWEFYKARTEEGVDGWWLDLGEPEQHDGDSHHQGGSVSQVHNEFGQLWIERVYKGLCDDFSYMRPFIMPRSGTSGMQRFSTFPWTGDIKRSWEGLQAQIPSLINMSMCGVSYIGSDIGGFTAENGYTNEDLYLRWVEFGALSPMLRTHSDTKPEPTSSEYSAKLPYIRDYINLRYRLLPYTYTLSYENSAFGYPMARPACAYDDNKSTLAGSNDSYLWGRDIFVAPVVKNASSRSITFPEGEWLDLYAAMMTTNEKPGIYNGSNGSTSSYTAPIQRLPFFLRKGAFLPTFTLKEGFKNTTDLKYNDITVYHFMNYEEKATGNNRSRYNGKIYLDDRTSTNSLEEGNHSIINFDAIKYDEDPKNEGQYLIKVTPDSYTSKYCGGDNITVQFHIYNCTFNTFDGMAILELGNVADASTVNALAETDQLSKITPSASLNDAQTSSGDAVYFDSANHHVYIKITRPANQSYAIGFGDTTTGVEELEIAGALHLEYCAGMLNYSVPERYESACIELFTADGKALGVVDGLTADGIVHGIDCPAAEGFCIARITASGKYGQKKSATAKFFVR